MWAVLFQTAMQNHEKNVRAFAVPIDIVSQVCRKMLVINHLSHIFKMTISLVSCKSLAVATLNQNHRDDNNAPNPYPILYI